MRIELSPVQRRWAIGSVIAVLLIAAGGVALVRFDPGGSSGTSSEAGGPGGATTLPEVRGRPGPVDGDDSTTTTQFMAPSSLPTTTTTVVTVPATAECKGALDLAKSGYALTQLQNKESGKAIVPYLVNIKLAMDEIATYSSGVTSTTAERLSQQTQALADRMTSAPSKEAATEVYRSEVGRYYSDVVALFSMLEGPCPGFNTPGAR